MRQITYEFRQGERVFSHTVDINTDNGKQHPQGPHEDWTKLDFCRCEGCEWDKDDYCPVATRLEKPVYLLNELRSYDEMDVTVTTPERTITKSGAVQDGLSGLFGLIMSRSGCPAFEPFRGLGWYHLPFSTYEETMFRVASAYFLQEYLKGHLPNDRTQVNAQIQGFYNGVNKVNRGIMERLKLGAAPRFDSAYNAIVILDSMGMIVSMSVDDALADIQEAFE
jgi:hypothetical protein